MILIDNVFDLYECIIEDILEKHFEFSEFKKDSLQIDNYYIDASQLNEILKIVFHLVSDNEYSFTISRKHYNQCKIDLFDNKNSDIKTFIINIKKSNKKFYSLKKKLFYLNNFILKKIRIIPVIGPDGVGKTTLIKLLLDEISEKSMYKHFKKIIRRSIIYNIFYPINKILLKRKLGKIPDKDQLDDTYAILSIVEGLIHYPYLVFLTIYKNNILFLDRFFYDYLLKDISFPDKITTLRDYWKLIIRCIPQTLWNIHLDAKSDIILQRKEELTPDDIKKYREFIFLIYLEKPSMFYTYINTKINVKHCKNILKQSGQNAEIFLN